MRYLAGPEVSKLLENVIHSGKQQHDYETDLTVASVYALRGGGALDLGGSEYSESQRDELAPRKRSEDDKYGWWDLEFGAYLIRFNEVPRLAVNHIGYIQPHERLMHAGATHPTFYFRDTRDYLETLLTVGAPRISIKQNARVSKLLVLQVDA